MAASQKFRSAFNGFNREDVVSYLECLNSRHEAELLRLKEETDSLRDQLTQLQQSIPEEDAPDTEAQAEAWARLEEENQQLRNQLEEQKQLGSRLDQLNMQLAQVTAERDEAMASLHRQEEKSCREEELEAYRRAERAERLAHSRAGQIYDQANGVLADTAAGLDRAAESLGRTAGEAMNQIRLLEQALAEGKAVLAEASASLGAIRPQNDET